MRKVQNLYLANQYDCVKSYIWEGIRKYANNIAFRIKHKEKDKVIYEDITYKIFGEQVRKLGTGLLKLGLQGKRIAIIGKNCYEWVLSYVSILGGVGVVVPLDKGLQEPEIESCMERSYADAIIFEQEYIEPMKAICKRNHSNTKLFICMNEIKQNLKEEFEKLQAQFFSMQEILQLGEKEIEQNNTSYDHLEIEPNALASIIFTSGTTSLSKAVMLSNRNIASNLYALKCIEKIYDTDVNLAFLPMHHTFGSTAQLFFLSEGVMNVFCDGLRHIQSNLKEYKVSIFVCVPLLLEAMYKKIMAEVDKQGKTALVKIMFPITRFLRKFGIDIRRKVFKQILDGLGGNIRFVISGASAIDKKVAKGFDNLGILTVQGYGLTETAPVLTAENEKCVKFGSVGVPLNNVEISIDEPNKKGIGEIIARGPNVMLGYYENEIATKKVIEEKNGERWFHTGDLGYLDKDGFLFITGRKKNVIVLKNGKNIYPEELELLVNNLAYVAESMIFGMPKADDLVLSVKIVYNKEYINEKFPSLTQEELREMVWKDIKQMNKSLPTYKHIKNLILTEEPMIKTTTAKIKRFEEIKKEIEKQQHLKVKTSEN